MSYCFKSWRAPKQTESRAGIAGQKCAALHLETLPVRLLLQGCAATGVQKMEDSSAVTLSSV